MKRYLIFLLCLPLVGLSQQMTKTISGTINDGREPLTNVSINVNDENKQFFTDSNGKYRIEAEVGDVLTYAFQGMKTVKIKVEDVTRILNLSMVPDVEELSEVIVVGSNRKSQKELQLEYAVNPRLIRTAYGILNADTAPGTIRFLYEDQISPVRLCILDVLRNRFPGLRVVGDCVGALGPSFAQGNGNITGQDSPDDDVPIGITRETALGNTGLVGKVFIRGANSVTNTRAAIFDVDGQLFDDVPIWIDVKNIKRLAVLNNFATTTMYGSAGVGGVVVINTIIASPVSGKLTDFARLRNNYVSGPMLSQEQIRANAPSYLQELHASGSLNEAKQVHAKYAKTYSSSPYFHLDAAHYFADKWGDKEFSNKIISDNYFRFENNAVLLKALAYRYQEAYRFEEANETYKQVLKLRPNYAQSYMDIANSYRELRNNKQAASIYARYEYLIDEGIMSPDSSGFTPIISREYNNLLSLNKKEVMSVAKANSLFVEDEAYFKKGTRLVFEWNDGEAEFELQFVNPENQYYTWKHTLADNQDRIFREKDLGYSAYEELLDDSLPGTWKINIKYLGNKSLTPTYLKVTVYDNYGTNAQRKETKVYKLSLKGTYQELLTLTKASKVAIR